MTAFVLTFRCTFYDFIVGLVLFDVAPSIPADAAVVAAESCKAVAAAATAVAVSVAAAVAGSGKR